MATRTFHPFRSERARAEYTTIDRDWARTWPVPFETRLVDTPSGRTFVRISGRVTDPPLVLLSGVRGTSLMWVHNIAALSAHYRTYALDTITDIGWSAPRREISSAQHLVDWLDEVFGVLVPEGPLDLMGMSYGGWLAAQYALRFPDRLRTVVMLAPGGTVLRFSFRFFARVMLLTVPLPGFGGTQPVRRVLDWVFQDTVRSGDAGRTLVERDIAAMVQAGRLFVLPRLVWPTILDDATWRAFSVPALFMVGENEKIYSPTAAIRRLNRVAPQVRTELIPGAGHDLTIVQAELVDRKVLEFLGAPPVRS
jgi:pimeloyl-ACP methyl ester carboxylesterase